MKIENVDEALCLFEEAAIKQEEAVRSGKSKIANRNYDKIKSIVIFLKNNKSLGRLAVYYVHPNLSVRAWAASYLLPLYEKESIRVLKEIVNMKTFGSLDAEMTIKEWKMVICVISIHYSCLPVQPDINIRLFQVMTLGHTIKTHSLEL